MGIEQAILELAAAIRELAAAAIRGAASSNLATGFGPLFVNGVDINADTIEQDVTRVETDAKAAQKRVMDLVEADRKPAANAKAAIAEALELAKKADAEKKAAAAPAPEDDPLDWDKDVRPALLAVGKDRDALVKLMGEYEVPKGGKAPVEKWADLLAEANAIVAARG